VRFLLDGAGPFPPPSAFGVRRGDFRDSEERASAGLTIFFFLLAPPHPPPPPPHPPPPPPPERLPFLRDRSGCQLDVEKPSLLGGVAFYYPVRTPLSFRRMFSLFRGKAAPFHWIGSHSGANDLLVPFVPVPVRKIVAKALLLSLPQPPLLHHDPRLLERFFQLA